MSTQPNLLGYVLVLLSLFLSSCDKAPPPQIIQSEPASAPAEYFLSASAASQFRLSINPLYVAYKTEGSIWLDVIYPEMTFKTTSNAKRFYTENGATTEDALRVYLDSVDTAQLVQNFEFRNGNDSGKFILINTLLKYPSYRKIPTDTSIQYFEKVDEYKYQTEDSSYRRLIITQDDGRVSYIECLPYTDCKGHTTWQGKIRITYRFDYSRINEAVIIDGEIIKLVESFQPTTI